METIVVIKFIEATMLPYGRNMVTFMELVWYTYRDKFISVLIRIWNIEIFPVEGMDHLSSLLKTMVVDVLVMQGARASSAMVLSWSSQNV